MVAMGRGQKTGWAAMRPVLLGFLLATDLFVVAVLVIARPKEWVPPTIAFGVLLVGLIWLEAWAIQHRHDDD
jgi:hypothetical protein